MAWWPLKRSTRGKTPHPRSHPSQRLRGWTMNLPSSTPQTLKSSQNSKSGYIGMGPLRSKILFLKLLWLPASSQLRILRKGGRSSLKRSSYIDRVRWHRYSRWMILSRLSLRRALLRIQGFRDLTFTLIKGQFHHSLNICSKKNGKCKKVKNFHISSLRNLPAGFKPTRKYSQNKNNQLTLEKGRFSDEMRSKLL